MGGGTGLRPVDSKPHSHCCNSSTFNLPTLSGVFFNPKFSDICRKVEKYVVYHSGYNCRVVNHKSVNHQSSGVGIKRKWKNITLERLMQDVSSPLSLSQITNPHRAGKQTKPCLLNCPILDKCSFLLSHYLVSRETPL